MNAAQNRVLIIDGSEIVTQRLHAAISRLSSALSIDLEPSLVSGLQLAEKRRHDIIIMDIFDGKTQVREGISTIKKLRMRQPCPTVVIYTNFYEDRYRDLCHINGADWFLDKSIDCDNLYNIVETTLRKKQLPIRDQEGIERPKCYVIDDDEDDKDFFKQALAKIDSNYTYLTATNGAEAVRTIKHGTVIPETIFLDINMPVMNGRQCLLELRKMKQLDQVPIYILSTCPSKSDVHLLKQNGAADVLVKPSRFEEMVRMLRSLL